jgi:hypothetical protein
MQQHRWWKKLQRCESTVAAERAKANRSFFSAQKSSNIQSAVRRGARYGGRFITRPKRKPRPKPGFS